MATELHLVNDIPYTETLCGKSLDGMDDAQWTDAIIEILDDYPTPEKGGVCPKCHKRAKRIVRNLDAGEEMRLEYAREMGMLHGVEGYNEAMGY